MGQAYSQEVAAYREASKKEAKQHGFLPNKFAVLHPLNKRPVGARDTRSERQVKEWDEKQEDKLLHRGTSVIVDVIEARRIGLEVVSSANTQNFIAIKFEQVSSRHSRPQLTGIPSDTQYSYFSESRGWRHEHWIDSFHMARFPILPVSTVSTVGCRISIKQGALTLDTATSTAETIYNLCPGLEVKLFSSRATGSKLLRRPTWFGWRPVALQGHRFTSEDKAAFIKISVHAVNDWEIPTLADFLPYTEVSHKSR